MFLRVSVLLFLFLIPIGSPAMVGEQESGASMVACSVSICKYEGVPQYINSENQIACERNDETISWLTEEIIGTSEADVLERFRDLYYETSGNGRDSSNFDTLIKKNWACGESRFFGGPRPLHDNPERTDHINPHFTWDDYSYDPETSIHTFIRVGYNDGADLIGYLTAWEKTKEFLCEQMGFREATGLTYYTFTGTGVHYEKNSSRMDTWTADGGHSQMINELKCRGPILDGQ